jgi:hypothetical protein
MDKQACENLIDRLTNMNINDSIDTILVSLNSLLNRNVLTQDDILSTGGLMGYLATDHELERYHGDLDLFINDQQLEMLYALI